MFIQNISNTTKMPSGIKRTKEQFIQISREKFPNINFGFDEVVWVNMATKIKIYCPICNDYFITLPSVHIRKESMGGCRKCADNLISKQQRYTQNEWISAVQEIHNNYYTYNDVKYNGSNEKVIITCPEHGNFSQNPTEHMAGKGCAKCGYKNIAETKFYKAEDFERIKNDLALIHNHKYNYTNIYRDNEGRLFIEGYCKKNHQLNQRLDHHFKGHGCVSCIPQYSKAQIEWLNFMEITEGIIEHAENGGEYKIPDSSYTVDGRNGNKLYEFQGDFWHGNPKRFNLEEINPKTGTTYKYLYERTNRKIEYLKNKGYDVIVMWEYDWELGKNAVIKLQKKWRLYKLYNKN